ncbi:MAG: flagellar basal body P-ring formation chaperone FlgA [Woeseiaceae bacterium]
MSTSVNAAQQWQPNADIAAAAEEHLRQMTGAGASGTTVQAGALDPRHRLPLCDKSLETFMRRGTQVKARTVVGVRCTGSKPWKVYVTVDVVVMATVYTASRTLAKGHLLTDADLVGDKRDVSGLTAGYISNKKQLIGQRLRQQIIAGRMITPTMLQANNIIRRGQTVTLLAQNSSINISMTGKSLMDGALNQRIRVENLNSGRIVEGIVRSREHVEILMPENGNFIHANAKGMAEMADTQVSNNDR